MRKSSPVWTVTMHWKWVSWRPRHGLKLRAPHSFFFKSKGNPSADPKWGQGASHIRDDEFLELFSRLHISKDLRLTQLNHHHYPLLPGLVLSQLPRKLQGSLSPKAEDRNVLALKKKSARILWNWRDVFCVSLFLRVFSNLWTSKDTSNFKDEKSAVDRKQMTVWIQTPSNRPTSYIPDLP